MRRTLSFMAVRPIKSPGSDRTDLLARLSCYIRRVINIKSAHIYLDLIVTYLIAQLLYLIQKFPL